MTEYHKEKIGDCEKCDAKGVMVLRFKGKDHCRYCLYPDERKLEIDDFIIHKSPLSWPEIKQNG